MATPTVQQSFADLGPSLAEATFVVLDFETTGGSPAKNQITEIGAVKVRGGEVLAEFQTLVNPGAPIPAQITLLTGITNAMVSNAPPISAALPSFLEFIRGAVLVAHNAPFDIGFLKAALERNSYPPPSSRVVDTVRLARALITRDEVPNHKLATLARFFNVPVQPTHRALDDAKATVSVLHGLFERAGAVGVTHLEDLPQLTANVPRARREKIHLAHGLSSSAGVYIFKDAAGSPLYIGKSNNIRRRVKSYFTGAETRKRINEMIQLSQEITQIPCATEVEAHIRELRLILEHQPPYNRHGKHQRDAWIRITDEPYPRLSIVRKAPSPNSKYPRLIGPFSSTKQARVALSALHDTFAIRRCTGRLPLRPRSDATSCALAQIDKCGAPCIGNQNSADYQLVVEQLATAAFGNPKPIVDRQNQRMSDLASEQRYEEARDIRDRLGAVLNGIQRGQRIGALASCPEVLAARRNQDGGWEILLARYGKLAGTTVTPRHTDPRPAATALLETGSQIEVSRPGLPAGTPQEAEIILNWLNTPGTRLISIEGSWHSPIHGADQYRDLIATLSRTTGHDEDAYGRK